jgi:hypothetical protein
MSSTTPRTSSSGPSSPARVAGVLYLVPMLFGPFSMMYVPSVILVTGDPTATAHRLVASETLFRLGLLSDSAIVLSEVALTAVLYVLLRPAGRTLALTAAFARLAMTVIQAVNLFPLLAALQLASSASARSALDAAPIDALVLSALEVHGLGVHVWELFFALHCLLVGVLIVRSGAFPRVLGVGMGIAALGYALNGIGCLLLPGAAPLLGAIVAVAAIVGEVPFVLWLLFKRQVPERGLVVGGG